MDHKSFCVISPLPKTWIPHREGSQPARTGSETGGSEKVEQSESPEPQHLFIKEEIRRHSQGTEIWLDIALVYGDELTGALVLDRPGVRSLLADA
jgi:hypothetical protein